MDRAVLAAAGGADPEPDLAAAAALLPTMEGDTQYASYVRWGRAWQAFGTGRLADARREAEAAVAATAYFLPIALPLAARAALWEGDVDAAREIVGRLDASVVRGLAIGFDRITLRAGLAACEGRRADAVAGYREALRGWRQLGCAFDEAMAALDMAILLAPTDREMAEAPAAIEAARADVRPPGRRAAPRQARADRHGATGPAASRADRPRRDASAVASLSTGQRVARLVDDPVVAGRPVVRAETRTSTP